ncbi:MAG: 30S ribosomal protein S6 [Candidatus Dadabacteria bacterium]|nr:30S ribosomal protein S6 [Candidatus Dadabacteria bacterium]NIS08904.1 30S ribosomal protein S6 [Candidatus Dadabacteria bacterium]NIV43212.1 30S ribosomal protein S6 [Candidatus Dadabacteria bacterium]NIY21140.1 30S ribosomal protein S6 [Candidatus Dadabacteria bacterium]
MQSYETVFITPVDIAEENLNKVLDKIKEAVSKNDGEISKLEKWQQRELAYPINDLTKGIYYIAEYKANSDVVHDIEHNFKFLREDILRFLTIKTKPAKAKPEKAEASKPQTASAPTQATAPAAPKPEASAPVTETPEATATPESSSTEPAAASTDTDNSAFASPNSDSNDKGGES